MPLGGGRGSVGDSSLFFSCYHSLPFLTFFYRDFCAIPSLRSKIYCMNWLSGSKHGEAKKLIGQLADATKRERAAQDLIRMGADAVPALIEALQTRDRSEEHTSELQS